MVVARARKIAVVHLLGSMAFTKSNIKPKTVRLNPRTFNNKGKAKSAPNVIKRFFQLISRNNEIAPSSETPFLILEIKRFNKENIPRRRAERKGIKPEPGSLKLPNEALIDEIMITTATINKKILLSNSFLEFITKLTSITCAYFKITPLPHSCGSKLRGEG